MSSRSHAFRRKKPRPPQHRLARAALGILLLAASPLPAGIDDAWSGLFTLDTRDGLPAAWSEPFTLDTRDTTVAPAVTAVTGKYFHDGKTAFFLTELACQERIEATVDWKGQASGTVQFKRGGTVLQSGTAKILDIDVGSLSPLETITVQAVSADGTKTSTLRTANFLVMPVPGALAGLGSAESLLTTVERGDHVEYTFRNVTAWIFQDENIASLPNDTEGRTIPGCSGQPLAWAVAPGVSGSIKSDGTMKLDATGAKKKNEEDVSGLAPWNLLGREADPKYKFSFRGQYLGGQGWIYDGQGRLTLKTREATAPVRVWDQPQVFSKATLSVDIREQADIATHPGRDDIVWGLLQALPTGYTGISELQFYYVDHADRLTVTGAPAAVGSPTPDYGVQTAVTGGTQIACSVGETIAVDGNGTAWLYAGYTLKQGGMNVTGGVETTDFTYTHGGDAVLEWKWVQSDTIHIATNGNDSASGVSWATAKKTIDAALSAALDGQTIILSNGVYQLKSTVTITKAVTLTGFGGAENTVISTTNNIQLLTISKAAAVVKDLTFAGGTYFSDSTGYPDTPPLLCAGVLVTAGMLTNCTVRDCSVVRHAGGAALCVNGANALVAGCTITNNTAKAYGTGGRPYFLRGCAVTMTAGRVEDCEIAWNVGGSGVGAAVTGGTLANCRIHDNTGSYVGTLEGGAQPGENNAYSYGTVYIMGGTVTDCLIVGNRAATAAGVYLFKGGTLTNSIVADNVATMDYLGLDDSMNPKVMPEPGRRTGVGGVLVYGTSSRVVDCTITNNTSVWFGSGQGVTLLLGTVEDCRLKANGEAGGTAADFVSIGGTSGGLTITPRASGEGPSVTYAAPNDGAEGVYPYDTPEKAARTIQAAIDAVACPAGGLGTVVLLPGVHTNVAHGVWVNKVIKPVELVGQDGRDATFIDGLHLAHHRPLWLANRDAEVRGITLRNGNENGSGGNPWGSSVPSAAVLAQGTVDDCAVTGCVKSANSTAVFVTEGVVTNCVIANNYTGGYGDYDTGGGIRVYCGTVTDCVISNNAACNVGGVYVGASSAVVDRCIIERNRATAYENNAGGAGVYIAAGRVSNSLIVGNRVTQTGSNAKQGAGVQMAGGELVNCTVVSNTQATVAMTAGVYNHGGAVKNCIIWENGRDNAAPNLTLASGSITYSCYPDTAVAADPAYHNVIAEQPGFRTSGLPWRLGSLSPCVNAGAPGNWSAADRDLAGAARVFRKVVDIGAYEQTSAPALFILLQ